MATIVHASFGNPHPEAMKSESLNKCAIEKFIKLTPGKVRSSLNSE